MQPPSAQAMSSSVDFLAGLDGLFLKQDIELLEALSGCETKNRYSVTAVPQGAPDPTPRDWIQAFKKNAQYQPLMSAKEQSACFERLCCPFFRAFTLPFTDATGRSFFTVTRPFKCDLCYCPPCFTCTQQELAVHDMQGMPIASARERKSCCTSCCTRTFDTFDAKGALVYTVHASECSSSRGSNCCAPTCCNSTYDVDVKDPTGQLVSTTSWVWPGCNCGGLTESTNAMIRFPRSATPQQRAAVVGAMMLVEYAVIEFRSQKNQRNN